MAKSTLSSNVEANASIVCGKNHIFSKDIRSYCFLCFCCSLCVCIFRVRLVATRFRKCSKNWGEAVSLF